MSENIPQEKLVDRDSVSELLDKNLTYILKLAEAENLSDNQAVFSMTESIADAMIRTERPEFLDYLSTSAIKHATEKGAERIEKAIDAFISRYSEGSQK
ncbi:MAG: hypothetical protein WCQ00_04015 [bacterium]